MIIALVLTQFVFLTLGIIFLKGMVHANGDITSSPYFQFLDRNCLWFYLLPLVWIAFTQVAHQVNRIPFTLSVARTVGLLLSGICFIFFVSVIFFPSA